MLLSWPIIASHRIRPQNARLSAQHDFIPMYSDVTAGVIFNPDHVHVLCSYDTDGGSMHVTCEPPGVSDQCTPGCSDQPRGPREADRVYWGEGALGEMLDAQLERGRSGPLHRYNEVVLDAFHLRGHLAHAIEAIFFTGAESSEHCVSTNQWANVVGDGRLNHCERYARVAHEHLLRRLRVTAEELPLLRLDVRATGSLPPFSLADDPHTDPIRLSRTGEVLSQLCLSNLRATRVAATSGVRPSLWVYEGQGNFDSLQKTSAAAPGVPNPSWPGEIVCVSLLPRADRRVCFDIRDAGAPSQAATDSPLLHFGCTTGLTAASIGDDPDAQADRAIVLGSYSTGGRAHATVHLTAHRKLPPAPPLAPAVASPPPPPSVCGSSSWCSTFMAWLAGQGDKAGTGRNKFYRLWGQQGFHYRSGRDQPGCWESLGGREFFTAAMRGSQCDRNWLEGALGGEHDVPHFPGGAAPALLGFDATIWEHCSQVSGHGVDLGGFSQQRLAQRCVSANRNILRIVDGQWSWNMCNQARHVEPKSAPTKHAHRCIHATSVARFYSSCSVCMWQVKTSPGSFVR